jgi:NADH:ubiquinone oxidoreductase subunit 6 (subunit J)
MTPIELCIYIFALMVMCILTGMALRSENSANRNGMNTLWTVFFLVMSIAIATWILIEGQILFEHAQSVVSDLNQPP